jgi:hypothetical protein
MFYFSLCPIQSIDPDVAMSSPPAGQTDAIMPSPRPGQPDAAMFYPLVAAT